MSKTMLKKELKKEIHQLNSVIDMMIIRGRSYKALARRHKFLVSELRSLNSRSIVLPGFMRRVGSLVSTFMF